MSVSFDLQNLQSSRNIATLVILLLVLHCVAASASAKAEAIDVDETSHVELLKRSAELIQVLTVREQEVDALKIAIDGAATQEQKKLLKRQLEATELVARQSRIFLAANQLRRSSLNVKPELRSRIEKIADRMTGKKAKPDAAQMRQAETLRIVANLLLASAHLRDIGSSDSADRISQEADLLEQSVSDTKR